MISSTNKTDIIEILLENGVKCPKLGGEGGSIPDKDILMGQSGYTCYRIDNNIIHYI